MDRLLEKLRRNMAELSVQGDDFTRQIWHMYATFEEFVDNQTGGEKPKTPAGAENVASFDQKIPSETAGMIGGSYLELTEMASSSVSPQIPSLEFLSSGTKDDMSLEYRRPHYRSKYRRGRKRLGVSNPLLETINSINWIQANDDPDSLNTEGSYSYGSMREHKYFGSKYGSDADRDSISYAGSNSIDSGYKSYCPTPEPLDGLLFSSEAGSKRGSISSQCSQKPRIPMGTRVLNRNSLPQYYTDEEPENMLTLGQSILNAIQQEQGESTVGLRPRSFSTSSAGYRPASPLSQRSVRTSCPNSRTHSPCYSSGKSSPSYRSKITGDVDDVSLLFSKRVQEDRDATALAPGNTATDSSGNFINVLDDKCRWSGVARVKKLRDKCRSNECSSSSESSCPSPSSNLPPGSERFSDVARCILEVVEDLQKAGEVTRSRVGSSSTPTLAPSRNPPVGLPNLDYHVYEEIMYDLMTSQTKAQQAPPPLPARPQVLRKPPPTRRTNPRSNIYSIFRDQGVRRGISESLEIEAQRPSSRRPAPRPPHFLTENEYGFVTSRSDLNF